MMSDKFIVPRYSENPKIFIEYWSSFYAYELEPYYTKNIKKPFKDFDSFHQLYVWKNGMNLSEKKLPSVKRLYKKSINYKKYNKKFSELVFEKEFELSKSKNSSIWMMFLMHLFRPSDYPLFDQHVYRAFYFLNDSIIKEIPPANKKKYSFFKDIYIPWFRSLKSQTGLSGKTLDEGLFTLGKYLSQAQNNSKKIKALL